MAIVLPLKIMKYRRRSSSSSSPAPYRRRRSFSPRKRYSPIVRRPRNRRSESSSDRRVRRNRVRRRRRSSSSSVSSSSGSSSSESSYSSSSSKNVSKKEDSPKPEVKPVVEKPTKTNNNVVRVVNISRNLKKEHIKEIFCDYGCIKRIDLPLERNLKIPRGYAYIQYDASDEAENAVQHMNLGQIDGLSITANVCHQDVLSQIPADDVSGDQSSKSDSSPVRGTKGARKRSTSSSTSPERRNNVRRNVRRASPRMKTRRRQSSSPPGRRYRRRSRSSSSSVDSKSNSSR